MGKGKLASEAGICLTFCVCVDTQRNGTADATFHDEAPAYEYILKEGWECDLVAVRIPHAMPHAYMRYTDAHAYIGYDNVIRLLALMGR